VDKDSGEVETDSGHVNKPDPWLGTGVDISVPTLGGLDRFLPSQFLESLPADEQSIRYRFDTHIV
jgi:hypothetical protein